MNMPRHCISFYCSNMVIWRGLFCAILRTIIYHSSIYILFHDMTWIEFDIDGNTYNCIPVDVAFLFNLISAIRMIHSVFWFADLS